MDEKSVIELVRNYALIVCKIYSGEKIYLFGS